MLVIKANHDRGVELEGVQGLVPRPVDIDQNLTGFETLRTLRIYHFSAPQVIVGHAEKDEVYVVVLAGSVELNVRSEQWSSNATPFVLTAANDRSCAACAAYLPPHAEYTLTSLSDADIAYARARPAASRAPAVFAAAPRMDDDGVCVLLDESKHAERLRIRLLRVSARLGSDALLPILQSGPSGEALIHVRTTPAHDAVRLDMPGMPASTLESWDTIAVAPGESPTLRVVAGASATSLIVAAR